MKQEQETELVEQHKKMGCKPSPTMELEVAVVGSKTFVG